MSHLTHIQSWKSTKNLVPLPYGRVSVQHYDGPMTVDAITTLLLNREAYRRTDFIVLRGEGMQTAVVAITRLETHIEQDKQIMVVPWGADLVMVEAALRKLSEGLEIHYATSQVPFACD